MTPPEAPDPGDPPEIDVRRAGPPDAAAVAETFWQARAAAVPSMPAVVHDRRSVDGFWASAVDSMEVWVACAPTRPGATAAVVGFVAMSEEWVHSLYVHPSHQGAGVGAMLLDLAKARRPDGFGLWVFASNHAARDFYARHGLVEVEHTDGSDNEERAPDTRVHWHPGECSHGVPRTVGSTDPHDDQEDARDAVPQEEDPSRPGL